jgi:hypothetical protein
MEDCPFSCDVTPGGAYFTYAKDQKEKKIDPDMYYTYKVVSLGWGYHDVVLVGANKANKDTVLRGQLVIIHAKYILPFMKVLDKEDDFVLISPNDSIRNG